MSTLRLGLGLLVAAGLIGQEMDPPGGTLVIAGGAAGADVYEAFVELAGGAEAPIVVIPTAGGGESYGPHYPGLARLRAAGARELTVLHTYDREESMDPGFAEPIRRARAVWFPGGRQWRLVDAYMGTPVLDEMRALLARGGVIGGSSAGATIQGEYLARGDSATNTVMMGDHEEGFGFLKGVAIDQHLLARNRQFDLLEVMEARPKLLGIGIDEGTAIVVRGNAFEVIGQSYVAVYSRKARLGEGMPFFLLKEGDRLDLETHAPRRARRVYEDLERVVVE